MSKRTVNASQLDFNEIKTNLIQYMKSQNSSVTDYNYEGSGVNTIMDMLAYITHINAINANMALNETFLDTSQLRESVVSHAKLLGYTPKSTKAPFATIDIRVDGLADSNGTPTWNSTITSGGSIEAQSLSIPRGTVIMCKFNGSDYQFVTIEEITADPVANSWYFSDVRIAQGVMKSASYIFDDTSNERYFCYDPYIDTSDKYFRVSIVPTISSEESIPYTHSTNIVDIDKDSNVYFLEESREGFYEVIFGDNVIGNKPNVGDSIIIEYLSVGPVLVNGAKVFSIGSIHGNSLISVVNVEPAYGGMPKEDIESIKYTAPRQYTSQNRAVTPEDYKAILLMSPYQIKSISVWGGEDNIPPEYGKVYISIRPGDNYGSDVYSIEDKEAIINDVIKPKNIISIQPVIVDPKYIDVHLSVSFKYDTSKTNKPGGAIANDIISNVITPYNENILSLFGGIFRHSNIIKLIEESDNSIVSCIVEVTMGRELDIPIREEGDYRAEFNQRTASLNFKDSHITSSPFIFNNETCKLTDYNNISEGKRIVQVVNLSGQVVHPNAGYVDSAIGCVYLIDFTVHGYLDNNTKLKVISKAASPDIAPLRNDMIRIRTEEVVVNPEVDNSQTGGQTINTTSVIGGY